jgi:FkbM family methyltransferase
MTRFLVQLNSWRFWRLRVRLGGNCFRPPTLDRLVALVLFRLGFMGREEFALFRWLLRPGMTVVDIGANQGVFTLFCADQVAPTGAVVAFEPDAEMFSALRANVNANAKTWVELQNLALGSEDAQLTFHISRLNRGDNRLAIGRPSATGDPTVRVVTLDRMLGGRPVDLVKMDVQGWEGAVLRGMKGLLASANPPWVHLEICPYILRKAGSSFEEIHDIFLQHGYALREADVRQAPLDLGRIAKLKGALGYVNALAVPSQRLRHDASARL